MNKTFTVLFVFLSLLSCGKKSESKTSSSPQPATTEEMMLPDSIDGVPTMAKSFKVNPKMINFSEAQKEKIHTAADLIKKVVASAEFRQEVLNYTYNGKKQFLDNKGMSNARIYQKILEASEKMLKRGKNNVMDIELQLYREETTTIGYTYPNVVRVYMNTKYFDRFSPVQVSDNMMHEWIHKLGFDHDVKYSPSREHSVPYAIGYIVKKLAENFTRQ